MYNNREEFGAASRVYRRGAVSLLRYSCHQLKVSAHCIEESMHHFLDNKYETLDY